MTQRTLGIALLALPLLACGGSGTAPAAPEAGTGRPAEVGAPRPRDGGRASDARPPRPPARPEAGTPPPRTDGGAPAPADGGARPGDGGPLCERLVPAEEVGCPRPPDGEPQACCAWTLDCVCVNPVPGDRDGDGYPDEEDCQPDDYWAHPGAPDVRCNGVDEDCDGRDFCPVDRDGDGFRAEVDCDDSNPAINPGATEILCNGIDEDCSSGDLCCHPDRDGDGERACYDDWGAHGDCDDTDPSVHHGNVEILCNGKDDDCEFGDCCDNDEDGDGFPCRLDCDDQNPDIFPGRPVKPTDCFPTDMNCDGVLGPGERCWGP